MELPLELRDLIYEIVESDHKSNLKDRQALLRVNRYVHDEVMNAVYGRHPLIIYLAAGSPFLFSGVTLTRLLRVKALHYIPRIEIVIEKNSYSLSYRKRRTRRSIMERFIAKVCAHGTPCEVIMDHLSDYTLDRLRHLVSHFEPGFIHGKLSIYRASYLSGKKVISRAEDLEKVFLREAPAGFKV